jgi:hypothetical protein
MRHISPPAAGRYAGMAFRERKKPGCAKKLKLLTLLLIPGLVYLPVRMEKMCEKAQKNTENPCTFPALVLYCNL